MVHAAQPIPGTQPPPAVLAHNPRATFERQPIPAGMRRLIGGNRSPGDIIAALAAPQGGRSPDAAKIEAAYIGFQTMLHNRLVRPESIYQRLATVHETDNVLDTQIFLQNNPKMQLWLGDKDLNQYRGESFPIVTRPHEASVMVPKNDIINDRFGLFASRISSMADAYGWALDDMVIGAIAAGIAGTSLGTTYDGQNLVDTDHTALSVGGTNQTNKVTGALSETTYQTAWQRFLTMVDENGVPYATSNKRMTLVVGPANRDVALKIINQPFQASGATNIYLGTADLLVTPWIASRTTKILGTSVTLTGTEWALIPQGSTAVIAQIKRGPQFLAVEEGELAFRSGKYLYGIEAEFGFAYGLWQEVVGGPGT
jgi:phage major head subunit gpT-like protein